MNRRIVIATIKSWNIENSKKLQGSLEDKFNIHIITKKTDLNFNKLKILKPKFIFFPHWSWIIPDKIYKSFECVIFHMTDLPFGRGGSPLQNLIIRGVKKTKISAIKAIKGLDAGPVYLKSDLSLNGRAGDIYKRASTIIFRKMIPFIALNEPIPIAQKGKVTIFKRRSNKQGNIEKLNNVNEVYDYIRMLDAEGYPPAYIKKGKFRIEFSNALLKNNCVLAKATIKVER